MWGEFKGFLGVLGVLQRFQSGVPLAALQEMGGWESIKLVQKYAHLSPEHLQQHAAILDGFSFGKDTNWTHKPNHETRKKSLNNCLG